MDKLGGVQNAAREAGDPIPTRLPGETLLFDVPSGLVRILDCDLVAAGIPKRDDRGRTVDVHAMRTTFGTLLSKTGTAPRTAQAAMRHSDIKLTMGVYTDTRLLDVRGAVEKLPTLPLTGGTRTTTGASIEARTSDDSVSAPNSVAPTPFLGRHSGATPGNERPNNDPQNEARAIDVSADCVNEKPSVTSTVTEGHRVGLIGFEPTTSWSRRRHYLHSSSVFALKTSDSRYSSTATGLDKTAQEGTFYRGFHRFEI